LNGICRVHYAAVLTWHGSWKQADEMLSKATADLSATRPPFAAEGLVCLGELRRRQGRFAEAERLFMQAESHPMAAVGMAELSLDRDDCHGAVALVERVLRRIPVANSTQRAAVLELAVRAKSAAGDVDGARGHLAEFVLGRAGRADPRAARRRVILQRRAGRGCRRRGVGGGRVRRRGRAVRAERRAL
jgi:Tfp pilus assembly protein PilF